MGFWVVAIPASMALVELVRRFFPQEALWKEIRACGRLPAFASDDGLWLCLDRAPFEVSE
jgi:hypothetical protein